MTKSLMSSKTGKPRYRYKVRIAFNGAWMIDRYAGARLVESGVICTWLSERMARRICKLLNAEQKGPAR